MIMPQSIFKRVFPAQAGVIPLTAAFVKFFAGFPRASGGDPFIFVTCQIITRFSPRKRG